ncbi:hypothetical protein BO443_220011 [Burkholderia orbicola]
MVNLLFCYDVRNLEHSLSPDCHHLETFRQEKTNSMHSAHQVSHQNGEL